MGAQMGALLSGCVRLATCCHDTRLSWAANREDFDMYIADHGRTQKTSSIFVAIQDNNVAEVKRHLVAGSCHDIIRGDETPLHLACRLGNHVVADCLLDNVCHAGIITKTGTPVHSLINAVKSGYIKDVIALCLLLRLANHGCNINGQGKKCRTALYCAVSVGLDTMAKGLLLLGADPDLAEQENGFSSLHMAVYQGNYHCISNIVHSKGTNLDARDNTDRTPLLLALLCVSTLVEESCGQLESLLGFYVGLDKLDDDVIRTRYAKMAIVELLVTAGANVYVLDSFGRSPLDIVRKLLTYEVNCHNVAYRYQMLHPTPGSEQTLKSPVKSMFTPLARLLVIHGPLLSPSRDVESLYWLDEFDGLPRSEDSEKPDKLMNMCRFEIRRHLGEVGKLHCVMSLPLPTQLLRYVQLDFI